jgi:thiamine-monophosphate kinase
MGEFELIRRYFTRPAREGAAGAGSVALGVGDDCALLNLAPGMQMAVSCDMLVSGRHFFADTDPRLLGHKALAVNLSDLAACGARPLAFTLALALPDARAEWLAPFSEGLWALADAHGCSLMGGDTTQGPLNICITVFGEVPRGQALLRSGAQAGDDVFVSGTLGHARMALEARWHKLMLPPEVMAHAAQRMDAPTPRIALGLALRGIASAAADVSDGLLGDLGHILERSGVGATINTALASRLLTAPGASAPARPAVAPDFVPDVLPYVLAGGDDYELVFTVPPGLRAAAQAAAVASNTPITRIGQIDAETGLRLVDAQGQPVANTFASFDHFAPGLSASNASLAER